MRSRATISITLGIAAVAALSAAAYGPHLHLAHTRHPKSGKPIIVPGQVGDATLLFNGWSIHPVGRSIPTGDMLLGGAISPDGKYYAVANCGFAPHAVHIIDLASEKEVATVPLMHAWNGIAWAQDGNTLYVAGGATDSQNNIYILEKQGDKWTQTRSLPLTGADPKKTSVCGLALSPDGATLYATNTSDGKVYVLDAKTGAAKFSCPAGDHPGLCRIAAGGKILGVLEWGGQELSGFRIQDDGKLAPLAQLATGEHPNDFLLASDGRIYVSCANSDQVSVFDAHNGAPIETIRTTLTPTSPAGSTPDALTISPDGKTLYVANADNNDVCVIDVAEPGKSKVRGFIPTGWYPTALSMTPDGKRLIVGSGKGVGAHPNPGTVKPQNPVAPSDYKFQYIGAQLNGLISFVDVPSDAQLTRYTQEVVANSPYNDQKLVALKSDHPCAIPTKVGDPSPIKHILYIIKENRTYDQVFGDLPKGNGDPSLTLFGRDVTPNHHALAEEFVLLDNLYCNGEVSQDGHPWCDSAFCDDFVERAWVLSYSGKKEPEGGDSVEVPHNGYLWDACSRNKLTYRSYGESLFARSSAEAPVPKVEGAKGLIGHGSAAYLGIGRPANAGRMRDTDKADVFIKELKEFERTNTIPNFMVMSLGEDHTSGTRPGSYTPKASVASNDVALGRIIEAISHSSAWKEFAIFVIEDDAQNGPDHIDSHRTVGLVISPYTRRHVVDSTMYSTSSMVRSIELILGLPPLSQYDAAATPMFNSFTDRADLTPYTTLKAQIDLTAKNDAKSFGAASSLRMDFREYDRADPDQLNAILWRSIKGAHAPLPAPRHGLISVSTPRSDD